MCAKGEEVGFCGVGVRRKVDKLDIGNEDRVGLSTKDELLSSLPLPHRQRGRGCGASACAGRGDRGGPRHLGVDGRDLYWLTCVGW